MTQIPNVKAPAWRIVVALVWCIAALAYVSYAAYSYAGLYQWLAEREQAWFGAFDPSFTFIVLLIALCMPALLSAPKQQRPTMRAAEPLASSRSVGKIVWGIAVAALLVGLGAAGLAWRQGTHTPLVVSFTLAAGSRVPPEADQLIVTGRAQRSRTVVLTETIRGSTIQTAYTPLVPSNWTDRQMIRFMMRERLSSGIEAPDTGEGVIRFGPAVIFRNELPGVVRADLIRGGILLAPDAVLLDENLDSATYGLWIVAFFGCVMAIGLAVTRWLTARAQNTRAVSTLPWAERAGHMAGPAVPLPRRWLLKLGSELMAELTQDGYEFPWIAVAVNAKPGLHAFLRYFTDAKTWPDHDPAIEAMVAEVDRRGDFTLFDDRGLQIKPFTLVNLDESSANLRY